MNSDIGYKRLGGFIVAGLLLMMGWRSDGWAQEQTQTAAATDYGASDSSEDSTEAATVSDSGSIDDTQVPETGYEAEATAVSPSDTMPEPSPSSAASEASPPSAPSAAGLISIDFKDADIRQVLRIIALKSGVDIVPSPSMEALVTIKLTNVPWEEALDIILRTYGFTYERKGHIVRVMTLEALEQEALATEVFPLNYAKAKEVPDIIKEMLSERGRVKYDDRTNTVIVTDIPANLFQIKRVVERLDQRTPQVLIETKVVETKLAKDEKLGIDWSDSFTATAASATAPTTFPFPRNKELGGLGHTFITQAGTVSSGTLTQNQYYRGGSGLIPDAGGTFTFGTLTSTGFSMVLNFLQSRTDTKIVSNPSISALNNQIAKIHIGSEYPIPNYSIDPSTGRTTISGYSSKPLGTVLEVTPHVNPNNEIVVEVKPNVTAFASKVTYDTGSSNSVSLPEFSIQTAQTQVRIKSGDTIAIGGLIKETTQKKEVKVPILGDIPVIGLLFKHVERYGTSDPARQDLLIFLTVRLMGEDAFASQSVAAAAPAQE